jgi:hypothetical protein
VEEVPANALVAREESTGSDAAEHNSLVGAKGKDLFFSCWLCFSWGIHWRETDIIISHSNASLIGMYTACCHGKRSLARSAREAEGHVTRSRGVYFFYAPSRLYT